MGSLKLILAIDAISPPLTGIGRYAWELASRLPHHPAINSLSFYSNGRWVNDPAGLLQLSSLRRKRKKKAIKAPRWYKDLLNARAFRGHVFHSPNYFLPRATDFAIATVHDLSAIKYRETLPVARRRQFDNEFSSSLERASHLITPSEVIRREVMQHFSWPANKITTVPNGVAPSFTPHQPSLMLIATLTQYDLVPDNYALCVSTLEPRKNIGALLCAYKNLPEGLRRRYPLVLVGHKGWLSETLHGAIEKGQSEGWIKYFGFVPELDLPALYAGARAFFYPSLYEGFGLPVLEAMASGVPVLTSDRSSLPEISGGAALLVDPDDVDALCRGVERVLLDSDWRAAATVNGLEIASHFTWEKCLENTVAVYAQLFDA